MQKSKPDVGASLTINIDGDSETPPRTSKWRTAKRDSLTDEEEDDEDDKDDEDDDESDDEGQGSGLRSPSTAVPASEVLGKRARGAKPVAGAERLTKSAVAGSSARGK